MSKESALSVLVLVGRGVWLMLCVLMSVLITYTMTQPTVEIEDGLESVLYTFLSGLITCMLWDYTRLTFKKVWSDR